jgi:hypothetical protein
MKHTVNAVVLAVTTDQALYVCEAIALPLPHGCFWQSRVAAQFRFDLNQTK